MRSRSVWNMSSASIMGMAIGVAAGVAAGLLAAPMRGSDMRARLRSRADSALDHGLTLLEEGRRAFRTSPESSVATPSGQLSATLGEIAAYHSGNELSSLEERR